MKRMMIILWMCAVLTPIDGNCENRILDLYDHRGEDTEALIKDGGFAALISYNGLRILFDTGTRPGILAHNFKALNVDLAGLDFIIISHNHLDHMGGLDIVLKANPNAKLFLPNEGNLGGGRISKRDEKFPRGYPARHGNTVFVLNDMSIYAHSLPIDNNSSFTE